MTVGLLRRRNDRDAKAEALLTEIDEALAALGVEQDAHREAIQRLRSDTRRRRWHPELPQHGTGI